MFPHNNQIAVTAYYLGGLDLVPMQHLADVFNDFQGRAALAVEPILRGAF